MPKMFSKNKIKSYLPHDQLNQKIWTSNGKLRTEVREKLMIIAGDFINYLGIPIDVLDVRFTGSLANFNYTPSSDIDLHLIIDFDSVNKDLDLVTEFMNAKRGFWNDRHDIRIEGFDVELYPEDVDEEHVASALFSIKDNKWIKTPSRFDSQPNLNAVYRKYKELVKRIEKIINSKNTDAEDISDLIEKIKKMRKAGLSRSGEMSVENLAYKLIRNSDYLQALFDKKIKLFDKSRSI
tara:strand:+ start:167 stop:877 length:711 start_codon:yes stop_codon:yes gene_type:complete